ncbi:DUF3159 domain-containing protein [Streptomyces sp. NPDC059398]|uniref:DUF3159 domain-containing protein n=1 Tax=Streptomyces sp. NPDC059398 TaxID=3346820 RepID=UPI00369E6DB7
MKTKGFSKTESGVRTEQRTEQAEPQRPSALDQMGGVRGVVYSTLPVLAFVVANNLGGLKVSIVAALSVAVAIGVERLVRKESVLPAIGGMFGVVIAVGIVWLTGSAKDYFLIGIWASLAGAVLCVLSVLVRWPLAGVVWNVTARKGSAWRTDRHSRISYDIATLVLAVVFGVRFAVQQYFYETDQVGSLGFAKIAMGFPLLALAFLVVAWAVRRSNKRLAAIGSPSVGPQR